MAVALTLLAVSCSDGSGGRPPIPGLDPTTTSPTTTAPTSTTSLPQVFEYPQVVIDNYMEACLDGGGFDEYCQCTIDAFQTQVSLQDFIELDRQVADDPDGPVPELFLDVIDSCLFGTDPLPSTTTTTQPPSAQTRDIDTIIALSITDLTEFWTEQLPILYGREYEDVEATVGYLPSSGDLPSCGAEEPDPGLYEGNAFYCRPGDYVAWDAEGLIPTLFDDYGDFAVALVMAHEWGHVVQARGRVFGPTIMTELQADCFAGAWTARVEAGTDNLVLAPGDLDEAVAGYLLFRDPPGTSPSDEGAHGSAFDRVGAFEDGFRNGAGACVGYEDGDFVVVDIPLTEQDLITGGDLPLADTAPILIEDLEAWWAVALPEVFAVDYVPLTAFGPYFVSTGELPACDGLTIDDYSNNAFYCPSGDYVAWDDEVLFPDLHASIGDFAIGIVLAHEWAHAIQARLGLPTEGIAAELQADCLAGGWSGGVAFGESPTGLALSAGDLDEAIAGFLIFGDAPGEEAMTGTAFERIAAFKDGFLGGPGVCVGS